jgi:hypothetical protein
MMGFFSLRCRVQTSCGARPASYPMGTGGSYMRGKAVGAWSWVMRGCIPSLAQYVFMAWCLVKHSDNFSFLPRATSVHLKYRCEWCCHCTSPEFCEQDMKKLIRRGYKCPNLVTVFISCFMPAFLAVNKLVGYSKLFSHFLWSIYVSQFVLWLSFCSFW